MLAEEPLAGEPARALHAVEVVIAPHLPMAEVLADPEVPRHPVDPALEVDVDTSLAAVLDLVAGEKLLPLEPLQPGDDQARDPRAGHAGRRGRTGVGGIGPA